MVAHSLVSTNWWGGQASGCSWNTDLKMSFTWGFIKTTSWGLCHLLSIHYNDCCTNKLLCVFEIFVVANLEFGTMAGAHTLVGGQAKTHRNGNHSCCALESYMVAHTLVPWLVTINSWNTKANP